MSRLVTITLHNVFIPILVVSSSIVGVRRSDIGWLGGGVVRGTNYGLGSARLVLVSEILLDSFVDLSLFFSLLSGFLLSFLLKNLLSCFLDFHLLDDSLSESFCFFSGFCFGFSLFLFTLSQGGLLCFLFLLLG